MGKNIICNHYNDNSEECMYNGKTCSNDNSSECCYNCKKEEDCKYSCNLGVVVADYIYKTIKDYGGVQDMIVYHFNEDYFELNCILCRHTFMSTDNLIFLEPSEVIKQYVDHLEGCDYFETNY